VQLADVWDAFVQAEPDAEALAARAGWRPEEVGAIEAYRGSHSRYHFVNVGEVCELFCRRPGGFDRVAIRVPTYVLGERCPMLTLRRTED
jgi:hypothetical protein